MATTISPVSSGIAALILKKSTAAEREAAYQASLALVARIDDDLRRGVRHYRDRAGGLLTTLDEVMRAILSDDLLVPEAAELAA